MAVLFTLKFTDSAIKMVEGKVTNFCFQLLSEAFNLAYLKENITTKAESCNYLEVLLVK